MVIAYRTLFSLDRVVMPIRIEPLKFVHDYLL